MFRIIMYNMHLGVRIQDWTHLISCVPTKNFRALNTFNSDLVCQLSVKEQIQSRTTVPTFEVKRGSLSFEWQDSASDLLHLPPVSMNQIYTCQKKQMAKNNTQSCL